MLKDLYKPLEGHFKIESIDAEGKVIDSYDEHNLIMDDARPSMAELFAGLSSAPSVNKIVFGTLGHVTSDATGTSPDIRIPKTAAEGFQAARDRAFSESIQLDDTGNFDLLQGDLIQYTGTANATATLNHYYEYTAKTRILAAQAADQLNIPKVSLDFNDGNWIIHGATAPYFYSVEFDLPGTASGAAINIVETDGAVGSSVSIEQIENTVEFTFNLTVDAGNNQNVPIVGTSSFTEAAMYANGRIFAMKTFGAKIKDNTVVLRITWTVTF